MGVRLELDDGAIEIQRMTSYLLVVERGRLASTNDVRRYAKACEGARDEHELRILVVDARVDPTKTDPAARDAYWRWLGQGAFDRIAIVRDDEMLATELNMKALSQRMPVRAFTSLADAKNWALDDSARLSALPPAPPED